VNEAKNRESARCRALFYAPKWAVDQGMLGVSQKKPSRRLHLGFDFFHNTNAA